MRKFYWTVTFRDGTETWRIVWIGSKAASSGYLPVTYISAEVDNERRYTYTPLNVFMSCTGVTLPFCLWLCGLRATFCVVESIWNVMTHGEAREGKWRGNWRMECVSSTLHTTSEHGVPSIIIIIFFNYALQPFNAYCAIWGVRRSNFRHQASPRVSPRESTQRRKVELWARNVR